MLEINKQCHVQIKTNKHVTCRQSEEIILVTKQILEMQ